MTPETIPQYEQRFRELIRVVETALSDIQAGRVPNLRNVEGEVSALCKKVESAAPAVAQNVQPLMAELIGKLDLLAQELMEFKQRAAGNA